MVLITIIEWKGIWLELASMSVIRWWILYVRPGDQWLFHIILLIIHIDSTTCHSLVYSWAVMYLCPLLHWWMYPNLNLHMATSIWLMWDPGIYCCGRAPRVASRLLSFQSLWNLCLPSLTAVAGKSEALYSWSKGIWICWWNEETEQRQEAACKSVPWCSRTATSSSYTLDGVSHRTLSNIDWPSYVDSGGLIKTATAEVCIYIVFMLYCVNDLHTGNILHLVSWVKGKEKWQNIKHIIKIHV